MADILHLPFALNLQTATETAPNKALQSAIDADLRDVVIIGRDRKGEIQVWGSQIDADAIIGLMQRGSVWLAKRTQVPVDDKA